MLLFPTVVAPPPGFGPFQLDDSDTVVWARVRAFASQILTYHLLKN